MKYLITGGCGFIGSNLALEVLRRGEELIIFDNLFRHGSANNLASLREEGSFHYFPFDIRNNNDVETVIKDVKPDVIFHLAGQVAMTTSIANPRMDFEVNTLGTFNILDSIRKHIPYASILYSSTNKVYGDFSNLNFEEREKRYVCTSYPNGFNESIGLDFHSPYGCSKGAAEQYLLDYARIYGINSAVFRHSSMYGGKQHPTIDQGWIGWFCQKAMEIKKGLNQGQFTISGNGKQVRDVLHAEDVVRLYFKALSQIDQIKGQAFNIGGGVENSLSLLELFLELEKNLSISMEYKRLPARESDQLVFISDNSKIKAYTNWEPSINATEGLRKMLQWIEFNMDNEIK
jgi:CDP-paratose 2-epimerase